MIFFYFFWLFIVKIRHFKSWRWMFFLLFFNLILFSLSFLYIDLLFFYYNFFFCYYEGCVGKTLTYNLRVMRNSFRISKWIICYWNGRSIYRRIFSGCIFTAGSNFKGIMYPLPRPISRKFLKFFPRRSPFLLCRN